MPDAKWELIEGIRLIRRMEAAAVEHKWNVHFALGGGVLMRGWSENDLDIICYDHDHHPIEKEKVMGLISALTKWEFTDPRHTGTRQYEGQLVGFAFVYKTKDSQGRPIDLFFVEKTS